MSNVAMSNRTARIVLQVAIVGVLLVLWELAVIQHPKTLVPRPSSCLVALVAMARDGSIWPDLLASLQRVSIGFGIAVVIGVAAGFLFGLVRPLRDVCMFSFELLRPIPPIAWIPIAVALLGIGDPSAWLVIFIGAFYPILTNTLLGVSGVEKLHVEAAKVLGASRMRAFLHVVWPSSLPSIFAGLRVGLGFAWMCVVAAEMFASRSGLGYSIQLNRQVFQLDRVVAGMVTIAVVGFLMSRFMTSLEWLFVPWRREFLAKDFFTSTVLPKSRLPALRNDPGSPSGASNGESGQNGGAASRAIEAEPTLGGTDVSLQGVGFAYPGSPPILQNVNLNVKPGEVFCILGVSGCGKSTLLRLLAGLETVYSGNISAGGDKVSTHRPEITMVFQNFSLFPWKTVERNVRFAMDRHTNAAETRDADVRRLLNMVGLAHKSRVYPHHLSGGQQQRVAFARALANRPRLLLLDEPFSALDSLTRETLQEEVARVFSRTGITVVMVTHDIAEAVFMADRIAIMAPSGGKLLGEFSVPAARPRDNEFRNSSEFRALAKKLWQQMQPQRIATGVGQTS